MANLDNRTVETLRFLTAMLAEIAALLTVAQKRKERQEWGRRRRKLSRYKTAYSCCFFDINYFVIFNIHLLRLYSN